MTRLVWLLAACALVLAAPAAGARQPYPVLVQRDGLRVYAPAKSGTWGRCPRTAQPVRDRDLPTAARATLLAVPLLYRNDRGVDVRDATARAARLGVVWTRSGLARATCGARVAARTIAVNVRFPRVTWSASLSSAVFFVSRVPDGWVIWHQAH